MQTTVIGIGETGMGKSSFLNAYLQKQAFRDSDRPDSCTKITSMDSNIINNQTRKAIDTPGIKDTDNTDQENVKQLVEFLLNYNDGINVVAIVLNGQVDRFTKDTEKFIKIAHQMFNHPDFWEHLCIIFTKWYAVMTEAQKKMKQEEYKTKVIESIRKYTESDINVELPMFFVDSLNYQNDQKTKSELDKFNEFAFSKNAMRTTQVEVPNVFYEQVIPEKRENYRYKENLLSENNMKRTEYFANQSRNKLVDFYGNISYSDWKNDQEWEVVKEKKVSYEESGYRNTGSDIENIYNIVNTIEYVDGISVKKQYKVLIGNTKILYYTKYRRKVTIDFDGYPSYGDWINIDSYETRKNPEPWNFQIYNYYKSRYHEHHLKYLDTTMDNGWTCSNKSSSCELNDENKSKNVKRFICMQCDYNLCIKCMMKSYDKDDNKIISSNSSKLYLLNKTYYCKIHDHPLTFLDKSKDDGWACGGRNLENKCFSGITNYAQTKGMPRFRCEKCDFDLCENCMNNYKRTYEYEVNKSYSVDCHNHKLKYIKPVVSEDSDKTEDWVCDGKDTNAKCLSGLNGENQTKGFERFKCEECKYNLCRNCMDYHYKEEGCIIF